MRLMRFVAATVGFVALAALALPLGTVHAQSARPLPEPAITGCHVEFNAPANAIDLTCDGGWRGRVTGQDSAPPTQMLFAEMTNDWSGATQHRETRWYNGNSLNQSFPLMDIYLAPGDVPTTV